MGLPIIPLPTDFVTVNGTRVDFRSLSRAEALMLQDFRGREGEAELFILSKATDATEDEARAFRESTTTEEAGKLIDGILIFSGLATATEAVKAAAKGEVLPDPKADMNGHSKTEPLTLTRS